MPNGGLKADAILAKKVWDDSFTFTNAADWGTNYPDTYQRGNGSVDGSTARVVVSTYYYSGITSVPRISYGYVQFDFYVPADPADRWPYYWLNEGGQFPVGIEAFPDGDGTWWVDTYSRYSSVDAFYQFTPTASTWYRMKGVFNGIQGGLLAVKVWKIGDPEPDAFQVEGFIYPDTYFLPDPLDWYDLSIEVDAPHAEDGLFDNLIIADYGEPFSATKWKSLTADAIRRRAVTGSFSADALIVPLRFKADAWIVGGRSGHSRFWDHYGTEPDTVVVLDGPIGRFPSGTDVHTVLADIVSRIVALESGWHRTMVFTVDAWIRPFIRANAVLQKLDVVKNPAGVDLKFKADAAIVRGKTDQLITIDAWLIRASDQTFTASAYLIDIVC